MIQSIAARCLRAQSKAVLLAVALVLSVPAASTEAATVQVGFSPEGSARTLVLRVIDSAKHEIRMLGWRIRNSRATSGPEAARQLTTPYVH